jgi:hypothetical protein
MGAGGGHRDLLPHERPDHEFVRVYGAGNPDARSGLHEGSQYGVGRQHAIRLSRIRVHIEQCPDGGECRTLVRGGGEVQPRPQGPAPVLGAGGEDQNRGRSARQCQGASVPEILGPHQVGGLDTRDGADRQEAEDPGGVVRRGDGYLDLGVYRIVRGRTGSRPASS